MQSLTLKENFIFTCSVEYHQERKNSDSGEKKSILLMTIKAIYIFDKKQEDQVVFLEDKLLLKCLHDDIYIESYDNDKNEVIFRETKEAKKQREAEEAKKNSKSKKKKKGESKEQPDLRFVIKFLDTQTAKEYIKILALFEGWKLAVKSAKKSAEPITIREIGNDNDNDKNQRRNTKNYIINDTFPNIIYLFGIIDSFIEHDYVFQIDLYIMQLNKYYKSFLKEFFFFITIFEKIKIDILINESIADTLQEILPQELPDNINDNPFCYSLTHLSLKASGLKDSFAEKILPNFITNSPFLETLDLSNNFLTNKVFIIFIKDHINDSLKTLNLSNNCLSSKELSKYIFQISKVFLSITLFDLRGNQIDNRFLNSFNPKKYDELRNAIRNMIGNNSNNIYNSKEKVVFDLRCTNINIDKTCYRLYMKKKRELSGYLDIKNNYTDNYESKYFGIDNIIFYFDVYFFNKNNYRFDGCSKSKSKLNIDVKYYQLQLPKYIKEKKIIKNDEEKNYWIMNSFYDDLDVGNLEKIEEKKEEQNNEETINDNKSSGNRNMTSEEKSKNNNDTTNSKKTSSRRDENVETSNKKNSYSKGYRNTTSKNESKSHSQTCNLSNLNSHAFLEESNENDEEMEENAGNTTINNNENSKGINTTNNPNNNNTNINNNETNNNVEDKSNINNETNNEQTDIKENNICDNNDNDTIIIENTDDDSSEEEKKSPFAKRKETALPLKQRMLKENALPNNVTSRSNSKYIRNTVNIPHSKINLMKKQTELDFYRILFKYFFLLDYYFDPILNSFATQMPPGIRRDNAYMSIKNEDERYKALLNTINNINTENKDKKYKDQENDYIFPELYQNDVKQMYYDYQNMLYIIQKDGKKRKILTSDILIFIFRNNPQISLDVFRKKFNPNGLIDHLLYFYFFLGGPHDYKIKIPFTTLNKLISRIKLESLLCLKERSHNSLGSLSAIYSKPQGLKLSINSKVIDTFKHLTAKAKLIMIGLLKVINFEGYKGINNMERFLFETGNFLDIFLEKAESINLDNELVSICKYIQYWRDNYLRNVIFNLMHEIGKKEGTKRECDMTEEFAKANEDFKNVPIKNMGLSDDIKFREFAQHPSNVDYLYLSEQSDKDFEKDLNIITRYIKADQTYFKRNLYDRINFLFCSTSRTRKNKTNCYSLHKGNTYLKIMRILFRYNNNLDFKDLEKKMNDLNQDYSHINISNVKTTSIINAKIFNNMYFNSNNNYYNNHYLNDDNYEFDITESLDKIAIEENYLRVIDFPEEENQENIESEIMKRDKKKKRLLLHSNNYNEPDTLLDLSLDNKITPKQINLFTETTRVFKMKCQEKLLNLEEMTNPAFVIIVQNYIRYFLTIKEQFKNEGKLWEYQNLECFYQLYRFANIDNFSYNKGKNDIDYPFIFLYIMCFYFEFNIPMIRRVKGFAYYLFSHLNHRKHCKGIIRALNNPFRYNWVMSTYEIYRKIDCKPMNICVHYPSNDGSFREDFIITETSTANDLMKDILEYSLVLKDSKEKDFYWIYFTTNDQPSRYDHISCEQNLVELMGVEEERELDENDIMVERNENNESIYTEDHKRSSYKSSRKNRSNNDEIGEDNIYKSYSEDKTFKKMHFEVKRRIFTQNILNGNIKYYNYYEKELLFNQIQNIFTSSEIIDYTCSKTAERIATACYFENEAEKRRQAIIKRENDLESRISSSRVLTKFNMDMKDIELKPFLDNSSYSKDESFKTEKNFTYRKDMKSFGIQNSMGSSKFTKTYKTYRENNTNTYNSNMEIIKEEDDDKNDNNLSNNLHENNDNKEDGKSSIDYLDIVKFFPKNYELKEVQLLKEIRNEIGAKVEHLSDPKDIFFDLVKELPFLMANIFEVNLKQSNKSFPEKFLLSLNIDKVEFLYRANHNKFFEFKYEEIVKCLILDNYVLLLVLNVFNDEIDQRSEVILKIESMDNRFIMEDILSYSQLFLATKTKSRYVKIEEDLVSFLNGYKLMFDRILPFRSLPFPSSDEINKSNDKEIEKMRELLHNDEIYKKYKEDKAKKKEAETIVSKKRVFDIKSENIPRYNEFEDENSDSEKSSESIIVAGFKPNIIVDNNKNEQVNEGEGESGLQSNGKGPSSPSQNKEGEKVEEKEIQKTQEEIQKELEYQKKLKENDEKRQKVDAPLTKALRFDFDFDDDSNNEEEEEF